MKILFLALDVNIYNNTGDAIHVRELATSLASLGHNVCLVVPETNDGSPEMEALKNLRTLEIFLIKQKYRLRTISTIMFCRRIAKQNGSEIIYERRFTPKVSYVLNKLLRIPFIVEINGLIDKEMELKNNSGSTSSGLKGLRKRIWQNLFRPTKKIVVVSEGLKKGLSEEYGIDIKKIKVIFNGANTELFKPMNKEKCLEDLELEKGFKYVGFVGNLAPWQGVDQLISILPDIIKNISNAKMLIVGNGVNRKEIEKSALKLGVADNVIITGFVPYEKVPLYINSFDICVAPFNAIERNVKYSFSALKLYEYMACGKAVVTTDVSGIKNEITSNELGIVIKADDLSDLTSSILRLLTNTDLEKAMGNKAREWVLNEHSWMKVAERVALVCEE